VADKIITDKGTISLSIVDEIIKSDKLRTSGEDYGYYVNANGETVIGDQSEMNTNMYLDLNKEIKEGGEETTEELKELMGGATGISLPPRRDIPIITDITGLKFPSKEKISSDVTSFLNTLGVPMENSMFVSELLTNVNDSGIGIVDLTGIGELAEVAEGFSQFEMGLEQDSPGQVAEGLARTTLGAVGLAPFAKAIAEGATSLQPKILNTLQSMSDKAKMYLAKEGEGTKLLSTDPTDPVAKAIITLNELVNKQAKELDVPKAKDLIAKKGSGQNGKVVIKDIQDHLDQDHMERYGRVLDITNAEDRTIMAKNAGLEVVRMLKKNVSGKGWYDEDIQKTFTMLSKIPDAQTLATNETHRVIWSAISGAMSNGNDVPFNTKIATAQFLRLMRTGKMDLTAPAPGSTIEDIPNAGFGRRGPNVAKSLSIIQHLLDKFGEEKFADWWLSPHSMRELIALRQEAGLGSSKPGGIGGSLDDMFLGSMIIGDKTGKFSMNINGFEAPTKDVWFTRMVRRLEGTFKTKGKLADGSEMGQPKNLADREAMEAFVVDIQGVLKKEGIDLSKQDIQAILWYREQNLYTDLGVPSIPKKFSEGAELLNDLGSKDTGVLTGDVAETATEQGGESLTNFRQYSGKARTVRFNRRISELNNPGNNKTSSGPYSGEGSRNDEGGGVLVFSPNEEVLKRYQSAELTIPEVTLVNFDQGKKDYIDGVQEIYDTHKFGKQITPQTNESLQGAKIYRSSTGGGFAVKPDGDIVGVFEPKPNGGSYAMLQLAVDQGGKKLDAYDTYLPDVYGVVGFRPVSRISWNEKFAPEGWNKETYKEFNNGEPDIVFFVYDKNYFGGVDIQSLPVSSNYEEAVAIQDKALADMGGK